MARITPVSPQTENADEKAYLSAVKEKIGRVPNFFATAAHAPSIAAAFGAFNGALAETRLTASEREAIALSQAALHRCPYCSAAHTAIAKGSGVSAADAHDFLHGHAGDPRIQAVIEFAQAILKARGQVADKDIVAFRAAGFDDGHIIEVIAVITANTFTNFTNLIAQTDVDFPAVALPSETKA
ncbi:hypothetical protein BWR17_19185 (plasmid) [Phaeobacter inhibens]|uniref:carboxymuconolactone decarboxylase family protein n=1 Tax=Phaeobacter inhibens TaxID=221822 RepID=UPI0009718590|nr:carboxymuconolactone decarboxylase family protein [Phaeobacter inhibens]APX18016.1 hypothetical protein BWR17_19185 [Phaeobacter inhibens]